MKAFRQLIAILGPASIVAGCINTTEIERIVLGSLSGQITWEDGQIESQSSSFYHFHVEPDTFKISGGSYYQGDANFLALSFVDEAHVYTFQFSMGPVIETLVRLNRDLMTIDGDEIALGTEIQVPVDLKYGSKTSYETEEINIESRLVITEFKATRPREILIAPCDGNEVIAEGSGPALVATYELRNEVNGKSFVLQGTFEILLEIQHYNLSSTREC